MISDLLDKLFNRHRLPTSRETARQRLQFILAHDRADLSPDLVEQMRQEILEVVSRYVELDQEHLEFNLESDQRMTALIANLPIRRIRATSPGDTQRPEAAPPSTPSPEASTAPGDSGHPVAAPPPAATLEKPPTAATDSDPAVSPHPAKPNHD